MSEKPHHLNQDQTYDLEDFGEVRLKSQMQRTQITLDGYVNKWKKSDATKTTMLERLIGVAFFPVAAFWSVFLLFISLGFAAALIVLEAIGSMFGTKQEL